MIKLFEEYNSKFYQEINWKEYRYESANRLSISDNEITILEKLYGGYYMSNNIYKNHRERIAVTIHKLPDEWYYVSISLVNSNYYKCDQFDGLLKCLEDKLGAYF